jgi:two-component sensor histidine kinase
MGTLSQVYMDEYLSSVITHVAEFYSEGPRVRFEREVDSIRLDITAAVPCGMIVNELVSNALKYAFQGKEEGTIRISFLEENGSYLLSVADDGVGICQELERKDADTLGMWLVEVLAEQLGGRLAVKTEEGTAFTVSFPTKTVRGW